VTDGGAGVEAGIAWYDVSSRSVGPDHLPVLVLWETPRLCRGGIRSLTVPGVFERESPS
jgi:hypothetical protein